MSLKERFSILNCFTKRPRNRTRSTFLPPYNNIVPRGRMFLGKSEEPLKYRAVEDGNRSDEVGHRGVKRCDSLGSD